MTYAIKIEGAPQAGSLTWSISFGGKSEAEGHDTNESYIIDVVREMVKSLKTLQQPAPSK